MSVIAASRTLIEDPQRTVATRAATEDELASAEKHEGFRREWDDIIDRTLVEWGRDPTALEEDELIPPTLESVQLATRVARVFRDVGAPPPTRVVPDGDGGIVLERWSGNQTESFEISAYGRVECVVWVDRSVVQRIELLIEY